MSAQQLKLSGSGGQSGSIHGNITGSATGTFTLVQSLSGVFNAIFDYTNISGPMGNISTPILVLAGGSVIPSGGIVQANQLASGTDIDVGTY